VPETVRSNAAVLAEQDGPAEANCLYDGGSTGTFWLVQRLSAQNLAFQWGLDRSFVVM
jgi:hypothetical protein